MVTDMKKQQTYQIQDVLREMREEYWRGIEEAEEATASETRDFVVIRLGSERYGLSASAAREVLRIPRLIRVPRVVDHIRGVINLRGEIVAVTDLRRMLGLPGGDLPAGGRWWRLPGWSPPFWRNGWKESKASPSIRSNRVRRDWPGFPGRRLRDRRWGRKVC